MDLIALLKDLAPALALYVAIRTDIASMRVRLDHIERDLYKPLPPLPRN